MVTQLLSLKLGQISSCGFSPNGSYFALALQSHKVLILDIDSGKTLQTLEGHTQLVKDCVFSPTGFSLATASSDKTARIWNTQTGKVFHILNGHTLDVCSCSFSHDGVLLGTGSLDGTIHIWDAFTGTLVDILSDGWFHPITSCMFAPAGYDLAEGSLDTTIRIWDACSVRVHAYLKVEMNAMQCHKGTSLKHLDHTVGLSRPKAVLTGHTAAILTCSFLNDGNILCSIANDSTLRLWDVVLACSLCLIEIVSDQVSIPLWNCAISCDSVIAASVGVGSVFLIDGHSENMIYCFQGHDDYVTACQFSYGGDILATCSQDGVLCVWGIPTIAELNKTDTEIPDGQVKNVIEIQEPNTSLERAMKSLLHPQQERIHRKFISKSSNPCSPGISESDISSSQEDIQPVGKLSRSRACLNLAGFKSDGSSHDDLSISDGFFSSRYNASSSSLSTYSGRSHASDDRAKGIAKDLMLKRLSAELVQRVRDSELQETGSENSGSSVGQRTPGNVCAETRQAVSSHDQGQSLMNRQTVSNRPSLPERQALLERQSNLERHSLQDGQSLPNLERKSVSDRQSHLDTQLLSDRNSSSKRQSLSNMERQSLSDIQSDLDTQLLSDRNASSKRQSLSNMERQSLSDGQYHLGTQLSSDRNPSSKRQSLSNKQRQPLSELSERNFLLKRQSLSDMERQSSSDRQSDMDRQSLCDRQALSERWSLPNVDRKPLTEVQFLPQVLSQSVGQSLPNGQSLSHRQFQLNGQLLSHRQSLLNGQSLMDRQSVSERQSHLLDMDINARTHASNLMTYASNSARKHSLSKQKIFLQNSHESARQSAQRNADGVQNSNIKLWPGNVTILHAGGSQGRGTNAMADDMKVSRTNGKHLERHEEVFETKSETGVPVNEELRLRSISDTNLASNSKLFQMLKSKKSLEKDGSDDDGEIFV